MFAESVNEWIQMLQKIFTVRIFHTKKLLSSKASISSEVVNSIFFNVTRQSTTYY